MSHYHESIDDDTPEIEQYSVMAYLMENPQADVNIGPMDEGYQNWLKEQYLKPIDESHNEED